MVGAIVQLIIVLVIAFFLYWAILQKLWPLVPATFTGSFAGQVVFVLILILIVAFVIWWGVLPFLSAIPGSISGAGFLVAAAFTIKCWWYAAIVRKEALSDARCLS